VSLKTRRQVRIMEIIRDQIVETQEDLAGRLQREGIPVTQATVSRDIKEMRLVKVSTGDGRYRYALPEESRRSDISERILRIVRESVVSFDHSGNIVVVNTLAATAQGVAEAIDMMHAEEVIGTLAGERTVLVVVRPPEAVDRFLDRLRRLVG